MRQATSRQTKPTQRITTATFGKLYAVVATPASNRRHQVIFEVTDRISARQSVAAVNRDTHKTGLRAFARPATVQLVG